VATVAGALPADASSPAQVQKTIRVGDSPGASAIDFLNGRVYVENGADGTVSVIQESSAKVVATIKVGFGMTGIAVDPLLGRVYTTVSGSENGSVAMIDVATDTVVARSAYDGDATDIAVDPVTHEVIVSTIADVTEEGNVGVVYVVNGHTAAIERSVRIGFNPTTMTIDPVAGRVYVVNGDAVSTISVIDYRHGKVVASLAADNEINGLAVDVLHHVLYVTVFGAVEFFDTRTDAQIGFLWPSDEDTAFVAVDVDEVHGIGYLTDGGTVTELNLQTRAVIAEVTVGGYLTWVSADLVHGTAYVTNESTGTVVVI
jgi:YVTN family beta-propeller protein